VGLLERELEGGILVRVLGAVLLGEEESNALLLLRGSLVQLVGLRAGLDDVAEPESGNARSLRGLGLLDLLDFLRGLGLLGLLGLDSLGLLGSDNQSRARAAGDGSRAGALEHQEVLHRQIADVEERGHLYFREGLDGCCVSKSGSESNKAEER